MKSSWFIALRYFFSKKNPNSVNFITGIALFGYAIGAFALLVFMSAMNGFEKLIFEVYENSYADMRILPQKGKVFRLDSLALTKVSAISGVKKVAYTLEENAVLEAAENQGVCLVKGVSTNYHEVIPIQKLLAAGNPEMNDGSGPIALASEGLVYKMNIAGKSMVKLLSPDRESFGIANIQLNEGEIRVGGLLHLDENQNEQLILVPYDFANELFQRDSAFSSLEIALHPSASISSVKKQIALILGNGFVVKDRIQQNDAVYKMFTSEKAITFAIMSFILLLITFNLTGSLAMLSLEKKADRFTLSAIGARPAFIRNIFLNEGLLIAVLGAILGVILGIAAVYLQSAFGWIKLSSGLAAAYPVALRFYDVLGILLLCSSLGVLGAIIPAWNSMRTR